MKIRRLSVMHRIKRYILSSKVSIIALVIVSAFTIPIAFISPKCFQILIDDVMKEQNFDKFALVVIGLLLVYVFRLILGSINLFCSNKLLNRFTLSLREDVWNAILKLDFIEYQKSDVGDLKMRIFDDVDSLGNFIKEQVVDVVYNTLVVGVCLYIIIRINWMMSLICLSILPLVFFVNHLIGIGQKKVNEDIRKVCENYYTFEFNALQYWKEIKVHCAEKSFVDHFHTYRKTLAKLGIRNIKYWFYSEVFTDFKANYLTKVLVYITGAFFVIRGQLSVGVLIMFAEYFSLLFTSINTVNEKNVALKVNIPYYNRVFKLLDCAKNTKTTQIRKADFSNNITMKDVKFRYRLDQKEVLQNINLKICAGEYVAVIGKSGCGKTTLIKLLLGLYKPEQGSVLIDGIPLSMCDKDKLFHQIGVVMQDNTVFNVSIRENLLMAKQNATQEEIESACMQANILDFIQQLPEQFETIIGERGIRLSGGQKQRLVIAQALLKKPRLIIFDEATSALDKLSEDSIDRSICKLAKGQDNQCVTILIISHKPSAVLRASRTMVIENGTIADTGSYHELIVRNNLYQQIAASAYTDTLRKEA